MGLMSKYPELDFLSQVYDGEEVEVFETLEMDSFFLDVDIVYVYRFAKGLEKLLEWVKKGKHRDLVILEDRVGVAKKIVEENEDDLFLHDQVHFRLKIPEMNFEEFAESLAVEFPFSRIQVITATVTPAFEELKLLIMRKSVVQEAVLTEMLNYHHLHTNLSKNFPRFEEAFDVGKLKNAFKDIPAILCGAGPSLAKVKDEIKGAENRSIIIGCGSGITALGSMGIEAHLIYAFDPNPEEFTRLALHAQMTSPLVFASRVHPDIFYAHAGPLGYFPTGTGGGLESFLEKELGITDHKILEGLSEEALSVTTVALMTAIYFGCNPIFFAGIDLSYGAGKRYAPGVISDLHCFLEEEDLKAAETKMVVEGHLTATKWLMERDVIADVIEKHPHLSFIRTSDEGLPIKGASYDANWVLKLAPPQDIKGVVQDKVLAASFAFKEGIVEKKLHVFYESLKKCEEIIRLILQELQTIYPNLAGKEETPRMIVFEMDLEEESAFQVALKPASYALLKHLSREYRESSDKIRRTYLIKCQLYTKLHEIALAYLTEK